MSENKTRRDFLSGATRVASASALAGIALPHVHAASTDTIRIALVGCGGRGTGAAQDAFTANNGPVKLVAMADVQTKRLNDSYDKLASKFAAQMDVPQDRRFIGYDAFAQAMDALRPGDVVILATPPAFRWHHFTRAIDKGINVFMEKPVTVDGPTTKRMMGLAEKASAKNLKVGVGLMVRHCRARQELLKRLQDGAIGDIVAMRGYRMGQGGGTIPPIPAGANELEWQIQHFHAMLWASGGVFSDYYIHQIDECSWMKGAWPVEAHAVGGRHYRGDSLDQNFDVYSVQYVYPDGTRLFFDGRNMKGAMDEFGSYLHGSKGSAVVSTLGHTPGRTRIYKGQNIQPVRSRADIAKIDGDPNLVWAYPQPEKSPYVFEWEDLLDAIRNDRKYNEVPRGAQASLVASMGRMAAHTGRPCTYEQIANCPHEFAPDVDKLTLNGPAPVRLGPDGRYPVPEPGVKIDREY